MADAPTAIVTGGSSGIGAAIADRLATAGYRLVVVDLERPASADHRFVAADVADAQAWAELAGSLRGEGADTALLVQAAGALLVGRLSDCPAEEIERLVRVNLSGVLLGAAALGPLLRKSAEAPGAATPPLPRGVLNVASIFAAVTPPGFAVYNATKAGVVAATETLRSEWAPHGLNATAVLPGVTPTGLFDRAAYPDDRFREPIRRRVAEAQLTAGVVAERALDAYRRGNAVAAIGARARRYHLLKRLAPTALLRAIARQARRELPE